MPLPGRQDIGCEHLAVLLLDLLLGGQCHLHLLRRSGPNGGLVLRLGSVRGIVLFPEDAQDALVADHRWVVLNLERLRVAVAAAHAAVGGVRRIPASVAHPGADNTLKPRERGFRVPESAKRQKRHFRCLGSHGAGRLGLGSRSRRVWRRARLGLRGHAAGWQGRAAGGQCQACPVGGRTERDAAVAGVAPSTADRSASPVKSDRNEACRGGHGGDDHLVACSGGALRAGLEVLRFEG
mmetsp:Transcript_48565/g.122621  ORF Transcript_48565/g.122621 Transcript_48565/m.122621 type:complete len:238 (+) Transcript_48565:286-999(+)